MKLLTKAIEKALYKNDLKVIESNGEYSLMDTKVVVKYFDCTGTATWWIVSGTPIDSEGNMTTPEKATDWHLFGRCDLFGDGGELGYVMLSELKSVGPRINRDMYSTLPLLKDAKI